MHRNLKFSDEKVEKRRSVPLGATNTSDNGSAKYFFRNPNTLLSSERQLAEGVKEKTVPVHKVKGGYRWGSKGKVYPTKAQAAKQGRAAYASGYKSKKRKNK